MNTENILQVLQKNLNKVWHNSIHLVEHCITLYCFMLSFVFFLFVWLNLFFTACIWNCNPIFLSSSSVWSWQGVCVAFYFQFEFTTREQTTITSRYQWNDIDWCNVTFYKHSHWIIQCKGSPIKLALTCHIDVATFWLR